MKKNSAFTLVELLVVIAIISVLAALLLPTIQSALRSAQEITCLNTFRQVHLALAAYINESGDRHPTGAPGYDGFASRYLWSYYGSASREEFQNVHTGPQRCPVLEPWKACPYIWYRGTPKMCFKRQAGSELNELLVRSTGNFPGYADYAMLAGRSYSGIKNITQLITYYHIVPRQYGYWWGQSEEYNPYTTGPKPTTFLPAAGNFWNITSPACFWHVDPSPGRGAIPLLLGDGHVEHMMYPEFVERYQNDSLRCKVDK